MASSYQRVNIRNSDGTPINSSTPLSVNVTDADLNMVNNAATPLYVNATVTSLPDIEIDLTPSTILGGIKTVTPAATPVALYATPVPAQYVMMNALSTNAGIVYVGGSNVSTTTKNGLALTVPADGSGVKAPASCIIPIDDAAKIYINAATPSEGVQFVVIT